MDELNMFKEELIFLDIEGETKEEVLGNLSTKLFEIGYVKDSFKDAIIEREKNFPTGLPTEDVKVALPHTDTIHVEKPVIAIGILNSPVVFEDMGSGDELNIEIIFMLAVKDPSDQVNVLQKLIGSFVDSEFLLGLKNSKDNKEAYEIIKEKF